MLLVVLPPLLLLAIELLLGLIRPEVRRGAHVVFLGALVALIAAQALKKSIDASDIVLIALSRGDRRGGSPRSGHAPSRSARS